MLTKEQVADNFIEAGCGNISITDEDMQAIGLPPLPKTEDWFCFCSSIYKHITGKDIEPCPFMGRGSSSRWFGKKVSDAILEKE